MRLQQREEDRAICADLLAPRYTIHVHNRCLFEHITVVVSFFDYKGIKTPWRV